MQPGPDQPGLQQGDWRGPLGRQLLAQGGKGLSLSSLHRHGADLQPLGCSAEREALEDREPQGHRLGSGELLDKLLQRQPIGAIAIRCLGLWGGQLIEQTGLAIGLGIEAAVAHWALALLVQLARHSHQPHPIAQVMLQGTGDAAAQIGRRRLTRAATGSGADQGFPGHLDQIIPLHQWEQAPGSSGSDGISEGQVLQHQSIAGLEGSAAEGCCWLPAAGGGKRGSHRGDGEEPHPHRPATTPRQGRPTQEGAWPDP